MSGGHTTKENKTRSLRAVAGSFLRWARALSHALWTDRIARTRAGILLSSLLICVYSVAVLLYVLTLPEIGVRCAFTPVVNQFDRDFLFPADQPPLQEGDHITRVGPYPVTTWAQLLRTMLLLREEQPQDARDVKTPEDLHPKLDPTLTHLEVQGQRVVRVGWERDGKAGEVWLRLGPSPVETLLPGVLWFCLNIGLFVVGALVFWKRPEDRPARLFFTLCLVTLGAFLGGYHWSRIITQPLLIAVFMACAVLLPAVTLHFYLSFPRPKAFFEEARGWLWLPVLYGPAVGFLVFFLSEYLRVRQIVAHPWGDGAAHSAVVNFLQQGVLNGIYVYFGIAVAWYLLSIACLAHSYAAARGATERNQVKWILIGSFASLVPIGYTLYLAFFERARFGAGAATWPMFLASACITVAYAFSITRYRLLDLDQMISSGAYYFLVMLTASVAYYGMLLIGLHQVFGVSVAALVLIAALNLAGGRLLRAVDKHFRREKYQLDRTLQCMSQAIEKLVDPPTLARHFLRTTADLLQATSGAVYLRQGEPALYVLADSLGADPPLTELPPGCPLVEALRAGGAQELDPAGTGPASRQLAFLRGVVAQPLTREGQLLGLLILGPRREGTYTAEDRQVLSAFAQITVPALLSAEGHQTIEDLNRDLKAKVEKIAELQRRVLALQSQLQRRQAGAEPEKKEAEAPPPPPTTPLTPEVEFRGSSPQVRQLLHLVRRVAASSSAVLLRGESGTGKELLARALHESSPRAERPFVKVHCAALSPGLLESELFGHVKGAFTSAIRDKVGRFESADGGTLFLDEIGDISLEVQTKLLRVLEEMSFERVGSSEPVHVDVRILAATHRDLEAMIGQGKFREDLYFRLNVLPIQVPPLRERREDIPELVDYFLRLYSERLGKAARAVEDEVLLALKAYSWPGNVRQLENVIERAVVVAEGPVISLAELPAEVRAEPAAAEEDGDGWPAAEANGLALPGLASLLSLSRAERERREREQLVRALAAAGGNKAVAARALGMARSTLISRLKRLGLS